MRTQGLLRPAFIVFLTLLSSCNSLPTAQTLPREQAREIDMAFVFRRQLELEPCGCSMRPLGGVIREQNALAENTKDAKFPVWAITGGGTFIPRGPYFKAQNLDLFSKKAGYMLKVLNQLNTKVLGLAMSDTLLGSSRLSSLSSQAKFPMISTNIVRKGKTEPAFAPSVEIPTGGATVVFLSLSAPLGNDYTSGSTDYEVRPPADVLREFFAKPFSGSRVVVAFNDLTIEDRAVLQKQFPQVSIWLGSDIANSWNPATQYSPEFFELTPLDRGRALGMIHVDLSDKPYWFNADRQQGVKLQRADREKLIKGLDKQLAKTKDTLRRLVLSQQREEAAQLLKDTERLSKMNPAQAKTYSAYGQDLTQSYDEPNNAMTALVDEYKQNVHDAALMEGGE